VGGGGSFGVGLNTFRHSGNLGDIVYSLPAVKALGGGIFYVDHHTGYQEKPPLGRDTGLMMTELLQTQDYIRRASLYEGQPVDYDLDRFRSKAVPVHLFNLWKHQADELAGVFFGGPVKDFRRLLIPRLEVDLPQYHWESVGLPGRANLTAPWITGIPPKPLAEIVVCRTARYPGTLAWRCLRDYARRAVFVGLEEEWAAFCREYCDLRFYRAESLLDFARVIAGARLYVGNQSFGLALAEAMLIPRVAELWETSPNRLADTKAHRALTQDLIEQYLRR